eukprot:7386644-Prymnesium_polylepis.2
MMRHMHLSARAGRGRALPGRDCGLVRTCIPHRRRETLPDPCVSRSADIPHLAHTLVAALIDQFEARAVSSVDGQQLAAIIARLGRWYVRRRRVWLIEQADLSLLCLCCTFLGVRICQPACHVVRDDGANELMRAWVGVHLVFAELRVEGRDPLTTKSHRQQNAAKVNCVRTLRFCCRQHVGTIWTTFHETVERWPHDKGDGRKWCSASDPLQEKCQVATKNVGQHLKQHNVRVPWNAAGSTPPKPVGCSRILGADLNFGRIATQQAYHVVSKMAPPRTCRVAEPAQTQTAIVLLAGREQSKMDIFR